VTMAFHRKPGWSKFLLTPAIHPLYLAEPGSPGIPEIPGPVPINSMTMVLPLPYPFPNPVTQPQPQGCFEHCALQTSALSCTCCSSLLVVLHSSESLRAYPVTLTS